MNKQIFTILPLVAATTILSAAAAGANQASTCREKQSGRAPDATTITAGSGKIARTSVAPGGQLAAEVEAVGAPGQALDYKLRAERSATYACVDGQGMLHADGSLRSTLEGAVEESGQLTADESGQGRAELVVEPPEETVNLACPQGFQPQLAAVSYSNVALETPSGGQSIGADTSETMLPSK